MGFIECGILIRLSDLFPVAQLWLLAERPRFFSPFSPEKFSFEPGCHLLRGSAAAIHTHKHSTHRI